MRTESVEYKIYDYEDIMKDEKLKEKVVDENRFINVDYEWYDLMIDDYTEQLEKMGYNEVKIFFSISGSQGDGACFTAKSISFDEAFLNRNGINVRLGLKDDFLYCLSGYVKKNSYMYSHSNTVDASVTAGNDTGHSRINDYFDDLVEKLEEAVDVEVKKFSDNMYEELREEYYARISDEAILEMIKENGYEFTADGKMWK